MPGIQQVLEEVPAEWGREWSTHVLEMGRHVTPPMATHLLSGSTWAAPGPREKNGWMDKWTNNKMHPWDSAGSLSQNLGLLSLPKLTFKLFI